MRNSGKNIPSRHRKRTRDIDKRKSGAEALESRVQRQEVIAGIGLKALKGADPRRLMEEVVAQVAETLNVEYCKVLELLPEGRALVLRAGVGWREGLVGHITVGTELDSQAGYTLLSDEPVVVEDLSTETRFSGPPLLRDHSVTSGISVVIQGKERPFGVLGAHSVRRRTFTKDDISFVQAAANIIGEAVARKRAEREIMNLAKFPEENPNPILRILSDGTIVYANSASLPLMNLWGCQAGHKAPEDISAIVTSTIGSNSSRESEFLAEDKIFSLIFTPVKDAPYTNVYGRDVTESRKAEEALNEQKSFAENLIQNSAVATFVLNHQHKIVFWNRACEELTGVSASDMIGTDDQWKPFYAQKRQVLADIIIDGGMENLPDLFSAFEQSPLLKDGLHSEKWFPNLNGRDRYIIFDAAPILNTRNEMIAVIETLQDITERKRAEEQVHFLAYYDGLTELPNRNFFKELLKRKIEYASRYDKIFAVILIDLDDFKRINDTLGHDTGDRLLQAVSSQLLRAIRRSDYAGRIVGEKTEDVARMGGDEFILLLHDLKGPRDVSRVAGRLLEKLSEPYDLGGHQVYVTASMGVAMFPEDGNDVDNLLKNADTALYHAKDKGKNTYQFYSKSMNVAALELLTMENDLRKALERNELLLYYQPKMDLATRRIIGTEALIRWRHPDSGLIPPSKFIPLAEASGLIMPIGEFVLRTACLQNKMWQDAGIKAMSVAVNVSTRQFDQKNLVKEIHEALNSAGLSPQYLELEITESTIMQNPEEAIRQLRELKVAGIRISIDDFGTGYSSLNYLKRLPLDSMKIDISFIRNVVSNPSDAVIVKTIIAMAHSLNLKVIAEGVETEQQLDFLQYHGCDEIQGYLLSLPLPVDEVVKLFTKGKMT